MSGAVGGGGAVAAGTPWARLGEFERTYSGAPWFEFCRNHAEVPVFAVVFYLGFVFYVPALMEHRPALSLKWPFAAWNVALALFSVCGSVRTLPHLTRALVAEGFDYTVCQDPRAWYFDGPVGLWVALFIFSKVPELLDTLFLVLQKKRVIFLGWFHHTTVMLYCWHAFHNCIASGLWFATMNYLVHSVMYTYYFMMVFKALRPYARAIAPIITTIQIAQMAVGVSVTVRSAQLHYQGRECAVDPANFKLGLGMYGSYLVLFSLLFLDKYFGSGPASARGGVASGKGAEKNPNLCGVELTKDGAGFFQPDEVDTIHAPVSAPRRSSKRD
uniref:Very-long-chain 3-oxoacyl-CoA synthase n=1 Tax=Mantoniella antarctica TaxID=81844 RepID=A0A7S0SE90_9CHLO|mmetsp:Transcript_21072/g.52094  ORF Transcript_21072/g.52094 Transcript_21072/m.52094 type:complete len:329 (+) Transcript_21072:174-1160(+)